MHQLTSSDKVLIGRESLTNGRRHASVGEDLAQVQVAAQRSSDHSAAIVSSVNRRTD